MSDVKSKSESKGFSWLRELCWPVYAYESTKVVVMIGMLALALFNYTCLRITKDALVLTAYGSGKDALPVLKMFLVFPATIFFVTKFWSLSNNVSKKNLFYVTLAPFLGFFIIFSLFIYPFTEYLHASPATIDAWQIAYPRLAAFVAVIGNWAYSLFYICAELWGNVVISLLFWNFANAAISKEDAKRLFFVFSSYANIGLYMGAVVTSYFSMASIKAKKIGGKFNADSTVLACVVISGLLFSFLYWYLNEVVLVKEGFDIDAVSSKFPAANAKKKTKPSFKESLSMILGSKYLLYVTILVLSYGMTANLVETNWKGIVKSLYPSSDEYKIFMCEFFKWTAISTFFIGMFCKGVVKRFGWLFGSLVTPIIMFITSVAFYVFILFGEYVLPSSVIAVSILYAAIVGAIQNILSKGAKYTLFDPTVQMAYQPLDEELKVKGKAAVDVIGGRAGKSLGGLLQIFVTFLIPTWRYGQHFAYMILVIILCIAWIYASIALSKEYAKLSAEFDEAEKAELRSRSAA